MRGEHWFVPEHPSGGDGLIPACAGSTIHAGCVRRGARAHPRMRGEHRVRPVALTEAEGSSPHTRGALHREQGGAGGVGLIPACAGSTRPQPHISPIWRAHPRMRGEHSTSSQTFARCSGSSPHARGVPPVRGAGRRPAGLIPACAGSTRVWSRRTRCGWAHPRMRGEHPTAGASGVQFWGSSPHARGARRSVPRARWREGLIPACAGSTGWTAPGRYRRCGSSPHARGAPGRWHSRLPRTGLIPACAGSTNRRRRAPTGRRAHPRMRGEHMVRRPHG